MKLFCSIRTKVVLILICIMTSTAFTSAWCENEQTKVFSEKEVIEKLKKLDSSHPANNKETEKEIISIIDKLRFSEEQSDIYKKWDAYLESISKYSNHDYLEVIKIFGYDYALSVKNLGECAKLEKEKAKQYSPVWLVDLHKKYGREYILNNKKSIGYVILGILSYRQSAECIEAQKDAIYKESRYTYILHRYIKYFLDYVDTLAKAEQERIRDKMEYAKSIQEIPVDPLKELIAHETAVYALQIASIINSNNFDPELKDFLMKHPCFAKSFDIGKALKDLQQYE